jgi:GntR family transcriptional regulator/MocR family aminotransferase
MDLPLSLNPQSPVSLYRQLYEALRQAILTGRLLPRQRIPSTRSLAQSLSLSRSTVTQAYEQLLSEGYLETRSGSGTFVCAQIPEELMHPDPIASLPPAIDTPVPLSSYGSQLTRLNLKLQNEPSTPINFRYGRPAFDQFPLQLWRKLLSRHSRNLDWLDYAADRLGEQSLREAIAQYLARSRAVQCHPDQILITNGTQQALYLILRLLMHPGEAIALEDPGYLSARRIFQSQAATLIPVPVDQAGLVVSQLPQFTTAPIKLVYVTPSHQFPSGAILSLPRRLELLHWAQQKGALIIEDDYDSEFRYRGRPIPALQGLDQTDSVLYVGTFSKVLFPSPRVGYLVLPQRWVETFAAAKWLSDRQLPLLDQRVLAEFIAAGHLDRHIREMRTCYDRRRQALVQALKTHFGNTVTILGEEAGIHVMVRFETPWCDQELLDRATQVGVGLLSAAPQYFKSAPGGEFIFGYGELTEDLIQQGISRLAQALRSS